ncbi:TetR/AcrR family transcriptional regulator [Sediminibacillus albus]|uniref:Regulatory protein, tetR family n=1 Tax=Sediminibacillus albus TaxID=407036 RepID=A0A1G8YAS2_9BACI|nr:TetR family transcriptional regulator C-terminal domain-containing protein [Sediminibacillus albus]SDJ99942.1 regulatory protein, tetR family [Sediminibacillus albus]
MPKKVNHQQRRQTIAKATWQVILKKGMEGATVRNIAKEAGLSLGALRYYFSTQEQLILYAMRLVKERAADRIVHIADQELPPKDKVLRILMEIVPANKETRAEMEVWFAFVAYARNKKEFFMEENDGIYTAVQRIIGCLADQRLLQPSLDIDIECEKLYALVDGMALHALLEPERLDKARIEKVFIDYLDSVLL